MDYYDEDFDEEIEESIGNTKDVKTSNKTKINNQTSQTSSKKELQTYQHTYKSSMKEVDNRSRHGIRKTVNLSKTHTRRDDEDDDDDDNYKEPVKIIQTKSKSTNRKRSPSYDDDIEEELNHGNIKSKSPVQKRKIRDFNALEQEAIRISKSHERKSVLSTPHPSVIFQVGYYDRFRDMFDSDAVGKEMKEIEAENNRLRESLKELNDQLTKIVDRSKFSSLAPKKMEFKNKNYEDKLRTTLKEIENNEKILEFTATEYTTLKSRLDQIKNPTYMLDLEDKISETISKIEVTRKSNKGLNLANGNFGKDLDEIDKADGVAPTIQEANKKAKEVAVLKRKLQKLQEQNQAFDEENDQKSAKYEKLQIEYQKIQAEANRYNIKAEDDKLIVRYTTLKNQIKTLEEHLRHASNKNEKYLKSQVERAIEDIYVANMKENENIERLDEMIEEQKEVLREMVEQEEHRTDKAVRDVISKIKASLDGKHLTVDPSFTVNDEAMKPQAKSVHNLQSKPPANNFKNNKEKYNNLPVYDVSKANVKVDTLLNKKDIIKKEITALKEKAKDEQTSKTPRGEKDQKEYFQQNKSNSKPNLREKRRDSVEEQQAEQQKPKISETKTQDPENVNLKPNFAKPNLFKKSENSNQTQTESLKLPETQNQKIESNDMGTMMTNRNSHRKEEPLILPGHQQIKKEEGLKLPGQDKPLVLGNEFSTPSGLKNTTFVTHQEGYGSNKKEELSLPGTFSDQKKKNNEELVLNNTNSNNYQKSQQQFSIQENVNSNANKSNKTDDFGEGINLGGLSRLNKLKKGTTTGNTNSNLDAEKITGLELPSQKHTGSNIGGQPLTLNPTNNNLNLEFANNNNKNSLGADKTERGRTQNKNYDDLFVSNDDFGLKSKDIGGKQNLFEDSTLNTNNNVGTLGNQQQRGRDRSHLTEKKTDDIVFDTKKETTLNKNTDDFLFGDTKKETTVKKNTDFDPDDIFGGGANNKKTEIGGLGLGFGGNFGKGIDGTTQRKREVKDPDFDDDDLFGTKSKPTGYNQNTKPMGMGILGDLGTEKPKYNVGSINNEQEIKGDAKRMRMNDLNKKTDNKEKENNLAKQAAGGGGFFDEFEF